MEDKKVKKTFKIKKLIYQDKVIVNNYIHDLLKKWREDKKKSAPSDD